MSRTTALVAAWIAAAALSILIASTAVGAVRGNVSERPQPLTAALPSAAATTTTPPTTRVGSTTVTTAPVTTTTAPSTTVTTAPEATTTSPPTTAGGVLKTYPVEGGSVSIEVFADHLVLLGAVPAAGYTVEEKSSSPKKIEIEFRSGEHESKFVAALEEEGLKITTEGDEHGDD